MRKYLFQIFAVALLFVTLFSCEDDGYLTSADVKLMFSSDTITFDTIFTTIGSTTKRFTVRNQYSEDVLVSQIRLVGGDASNFRINVNGMEGNELYDVEIPAKDSIYVFVEVTIDPTGQNLPMVVTDSIEFITNLNFQSVTLIAYGQDFNLIEREVLETQTWTSDKPYLVYDYAYVDSSSVLTIEPGTKIYFHDDAGLYVKGTIIADGEFDNQIQFLADRLESSYEDIPDQWSGVVLYSGSHDNVMDFVTIKNANIGLQVGTIEDDGYASLTLTNSKIENMSYAGIFAMKSKIYGYNDLIANCGYYAVALLVGGDYEFYHTTIANYWSYSSSTRTTPSLVVSNVLLVDDSDGSSISYSSDLTQATFGNSIIYGNLTTELELGDNGENSFEYLFDNCIIQIPDTVNTSNKSHYINVWKGSGYNPRFLDPYDDFNYELDSLSAAINIGKVSYSKLYPLDLLNTSRTSDDGPDLGAYEYFAEEDEN